MNAAQLQQAMMAAKKEIDDALAEWRRRIEDDAVADDEARRAKARAWIEAKTANPKATVGVIEAMVDLETAEKQRLARHAEGLKRSAAGAFDSKKQWLSALQSLASLTKAEAQIGAWEPSETRSA